MAKDEILQIRIELKGIEPSIWRRIQMPGSSTFWDLHVAIQNAMGWTDSHLHAFQVADPKSGRTRELGIPDDDGGLDIEPGWKHAVTEFLSVERSRAVYEYDFGDSWEHDVVLEEVLQADGGVYPRCVAGERACPPEDVGGAPGYQELLAAIANPDDEDHEGLLEWVGGAFDAEAFDAATVRFQDPEERWREVFGGGDEGSETGLPVFQPQIEGGFTPDEIATLMVNPFGDDSPLRLQTGLPDEAFEAAPIVRDMRRFLHLLASAGPLKLTQKGNLTKAALAELIQAGALGPSSWWEDRKTPTEAEAPRGTLLRMLADWTGLTRKRHGTLLLTKRGLAIAEGRTRAGELYRDLMERFAESLNWAYADPWPVSAWLQRGFWYALYLLQEYGEQKRSCVDYAQKFLAAFPMAMQDFEGLLYGEPAQMTGRAFERRVIGAFAVEFGLALREKAPGANLGDPLLVWAGPLLTQVVSWRRDAASESPEATEGTLPGPWAQAAQPEEPEAAGIAEPTIEEALAAFLTAQRRRLRSRQTVRKYEQVVELLQRHLDADGHQLLTDDERERFEARRGDGASQRSFCQIFGPEWIASSLNGFLGFFMVRKTTATPELVRAAGTVSKRLLAWLQMEQLLDDAEMVVELADPGATARDAARGREAAALLMAAAERFAHRVPELPDEDYVEFDHHTITRLEPGRLWLEVFGEGGKRVEMGPFRVRTGVTERLRPGWEVSCGLGRIGGRWEIVEVANVYPVG